MSGGGAMTFGREKRLLLGLVVLVAAVPLPFNEMVGWGTFGAFALAVVLFLHRAWRGEERWLPAWAANLAAIGYVPFLLLDLRAGLSGVPVQPVLRLGLFAVAVKLFSLSRERDKWHAVLGAFFLFLAAMATSVHLSLTLYLLVFLGLALLLLARFALLHLLAGFGWRGSEPLRVPLAGFLTAVAVATVVVAVPLFATLPRIDAPFLGGPGARRATAGEIPVAGYSDQVTLDSIGRLRDNREVALRLEYDGPGPSGEVRLKGGSYERFRDGRWLPSPTRRKLAPRGEGLTLASGTAVGKVVVQRMPLRANSLPLPVEALRVDDLRWHLALDRGGSLSSTNRPRERLDYEVVLGRGAVSAAEEPEDGPDAATLDLGGTTPRMAALASTVAGTGPPAEKAQRLERYLIENYEYTLDLLGRPGGEPIDRFLFEDRRGHCEYFASALVVLLRTQGIHARLVAGFLGAERNALDLWVVRQGNAHAWVEAWIPGEGWRVLDPTPPGGRPGADASSGLLSLASNLYDAMVVQWDRYVLSYDAADQGERVQGLVARLLALWHGWTGDEAPAVAAALGADAAAPAEALAAEPTEEGGARALPLLVIALGLALAAVAAWQRLRRPVDATGAYRRLRRRLAAAGLAVGEATGPLALARTAAAGLAAAAGPAERIVALYVKESFGGMPLDDGERAALAPALAEIHRAVRDASR